MIYKISAFAILAAFYICYLGKMILQRKAGIQTDQMGKGKSGSEKLIEIIMKIVTYSVVVVEVVSIVLETTILPEWARISGIVVGAVGVCFFIVAVVTMKDSWRAGVSHEEETELVTSGIFQISRNPAFVGFDLVYIGIVCLFFNWWLLALSILAMAMFHIQIVKNEEPFLIEAFGDEYVNYTKKVNRYIGRKQMASSKKY